MFPIIGSIGIVIILVIVSYIIIRGQPIHELFTNKNTRFSDLQNANKPSNVDNPPQNVDTPPQNVEQSRDSLSSYDPSNINEVFHKPELSGSEKEQQQQVFKPDLNLLHPPPIYNEPGTFKFDSVGYVPNYEESIYLSKVTGMSQVSTIVDAPYLEGGFCKQFENDKEKLNQKCNSLDKQTCASTDCCILFGGEKCVAGNEFGPTIRNVYSDFTTVNRDYYYYKGKCYGNCSKLAPSTMNQSVTTTSIATLTTPTTFNTSLITPTASIASLTTPIASIATLTTPTASLTPTLFTPTPTSFTPTPTSFTPTPTSFTSSPTASLTPIPTAFIASLTTPNPNLIIPKITMKPKRTFAPRKTKPIK